MITNCCKIFKIVKFKKIVYVGFFEFFGYRTKPGAQEVVSSWCTGSIGSVYRRFPHLKKGTAKKTNWYPKKTFSPGAAARATTSYALQYHFLSLLLLSSCWWWDEEGGPEWY